MEITTDPTNKEFGDYAEEIAAQEYLKKGYAILERKWRHGKSEIDLVVQKDNIIAFVEVKARNGRGMMPFESITHDKRRRMAKAADSYIRRQKGDFDYRFDFVGLTGNPEDYEIEVLEDAFLATDFH